jgi:hypothetical protein
MADYKQELSSALAELERTDEKRCGCQENKTASQDDPFSLGRKADVDPLSLELDSALKALVAEGRRPGESPLDASSAAERAFLEFSEVETSLPIALEEIISVAERYPGLKITFSF